MRGNACRSEVANRTEELLFDGVKDFEYAVTHGLELVDANGTDAGRIVQGAKGLLQICWVHGDKLKDVNIV